jgi:hypothetical protein
LGAIDTKFGVQIARKEVRIKKEERGRGNHELTRIIIDQEIRGKHERGRELFYNRKRRQRRGARISRRGTEGREVEKWKFKEQGFGYCLCVEN